MISAKKFKLRNSFSLSHSKSYSLGMQGAKKCLLHFKHKYLAIYLVKASKIFSTHFCSIMVIDTMVRYEKRNLKFF